MPFKPRFHGYEMSASQLSLAPLRSAQLLTRDSSRLLIIDMQTKLLAAMPTAAETIANCELLLQGAELLDVPVYATEQYPRGLGPTVEPLRARLDDCRDKLRFSSAGSWDWSRAAGETDRHQVVVAGLEAHICVLQTVLDLLAAGFAVHVAADAVASRRETDRIYAMQRLRDAGATITTVEAVLFEWCETAEHPQFKPLSALVKSHESRR